MIPQRFQLLWLVFQVSHWRQVGADGEYVCLGTRQASESLLFSAYMHLLDRRTLRIGLKRGNVEDSADGLNEKIVSQDSF